MNKMELDYYEAGIKDANEQRRITIACRSARYAELAKRDRLPICAQSVKNVTAYNNGVAYEINRQTKLGA